MSLLSATETDCQLYTRTITEDGYGGYTTAWTPGVTFKANIRLDNSMQARIGEKQGVTALYTVMTSKALNLQYHDVIKRLSDGKFFRITSDGDDKKTPKTATLDIRSVSAEEWELTTPETNETEVTT